MRPSVETTFCITCPDCNNSCLLIQAYNTAPSADFMNAVNSVVKFGDTTNAASSGMEIYGINHVLN